MRQLDRTGIFKARPISWAVKTFEGKQTVALNIGFVVTAQLDGSEWIDWSDYEEHAVYGDFWVVKKDGSINTTAVESLAESLGWAGDLRAVTKDPPNVEVQVTVKEDTYGEQTRYKVSWLNPGDYTPRPQGADDAEIGQLQARFGSLLRAAASSAAATAPKAQPKKSSPPPAPAVVEGEGEDAFGSYGHDEEVPF